MTPLLSRLMVISLRKATFRDRSLIGVGSPTSLPSAPKKGNEELKTEYRHLVQEVLLLRRSWATARGLK